MKNIFFLFTTLSLMALQSCQQDKGRNAGNDNPQVNTREETPVKMIEALVGEWTLAEDNDAGDNSNQAEPDDDQTLTFTQEARYIVREGDQKTDSGAYRMNEQLRNLYFESEANEDPREYEVVLKQDTLILSLKQNQDAGGGSRQMYIRSN